MTDHETAKGLIWVAAMMVAGTVGRLLMDDEPIKWRKFAGEVILSVVISITLYSFGVMQSMTEWQIIFIGGLAGIGGVKSVEWAVQIGKAIKKVS